MAKVQLQNGSENVYPVVDLHTITGSYRHNSSGGHGGAANNLVIKQYGKVVSIQGWISSLGALNVGPNLLGTIGGVDFPPNTIRTVFKIADAAYSNGTICYGIIDTNGEVTVTLPTSKSSGQTVTISVTYVAN